ncbi:MAG: hypothetical protein ACOCQ5_06210 [Halanaerobiales bacterium]
MAVLSLLKREIRENLFSTAVILLLTLVFYIFLYTRTTVNTLPVILAVIYIPLFVFPVYILFMGYRMFSKEWHNNTIFMLKSFPRTGYEIVLAKMLQVLLIILVFMLVSGSGIYLILSTNYSVLVQFLPDEINYLNWSAIISWSSMGYLWLCGFIYFTAQLSGLISFISGNFRWLIAIIVFYLTHYLTVRLGGYIFLLFSWFPNLNLNLINTATEEMNFISINGGALLTAILILIFLFTGCGYIYEKVLEV